ncbi:MAG: HipA N-terminal domain-containing protein [Nannocystales bacterium]
MNESPQRLFVRYRGTLVGVLEPWRFTYAPSWLGADDAWPVSSSLQLQEPAIEEGVHAWFDNLLPEGSTRERIARRLRIAPDDDWRLLVALGGECAGALVLDVDREPAASEPVGHYRQLSPAELARLVEPVAVAATLDESNRLSLAGAQDKLPVCVHADAILLPLAGAPSTHILKLPNPAFGWLPANEIHRREPCIFQRSQSRPDPRRRHASSCLAGVDQRPRARPRCLPGHHPDRDGDDHHR